MIEEFKEDVKPLYSLIEFSGLREEARLLFGLLTLKRKETKENSNLIKKVLKKHKMKQKELIEILKENGVKIHQSELSLMKNDKKEIPSMIQKALKEIL